MSAKVLVIGAGHNGLVAAWRLARAGHDVTVLERRGVPGGCVASEEFAPGFHAPIPNTLGPLRPALVRDMGLTGRVQWLRPDPRVITLAPDGHALAFSTDAAKTASAIHALSAADAARYETFSTTLQRLGGFLAGLLEMTPPSIDAPAAGEIWELLKTGKRFRSLGRQDGYRLLRWGPMAVADLVGEWFENDLLQAAVATRGVFGTAQGPWSAGSGAVLLLNAAADPAPAGSSVTVKGGPAALAAALADIARDAGVKIRTGAAVARLLVRDGKATGVALEDGTEITAQAVVSNADPRRTFLQLVDPIDLDPGFLTKVRNFRCRGTVAKVHLALGALPVFRGAGNTADLHGRILIAPGIDYLERAFDASKYGELPQEPYLEVTIPSLGDPALAPAGKHVMSVHVQFVPYQLSGEATLGDVRRTLERRVLDVLERFAPGLSAHVEASHVLLPVDLEEAYGISGGQIYHGEPALDQLFTMRPILGWAQYVTPIEGLFLCGSGTHPGGGITGASGDNAAREIAKHVRP